MAVNRRGQGETWLELSGALDDGCTEMPFIAPAFEAKHF
jgi:hypothetical protein